MAKKTGKKPKPKSMKELQASFPKLSPEDQVAKAKLSLDQEIISIYAKAITLLKEKEALEKRLLAVAKKVEGVDATILEAVDKWFPNKGGVSDLYLSRVYLDGLKEIAVNRDQNGASTPMRSGTRKKWDAPAVVDALGEVNSSDGFAEGAAVMAAVGVANIDLGVKRLGLVNGELFRVDEKGSKSPAVIKDGEVTKIKGKRSRYLVNVAKVLERLKK